MFIILDAHSGDAVTIILTNVSNSATKLKEINKNDNYHCISKARKQKGPVWNILKKTKIKQPF